MTKLNKHGFLLLFFYCFALVLYKALIIPITHDEAATAVHYINYSYWEIMMYPDSWPNNHILNSISVKFLTGIFGREQWVVRIPSLVAFWVYAYSIYVFLKLVFKTDSKLFLFGAIIFLLNFYLIDFFSLSRGYALSCAFLSLSAVFILKSFVEKSALFQWLGFISAILSSYSNFTSLVYFAAACCLFVFYFGFINQKKLKIFTWNNFLFLLICGAYGALIANPIIKMKQDDQFKYWTSKGFVKDTIETSVDCFKYGAKNLEGYNSYVLAIIVLITVVVIQIFWLYRIIKHKAFYESFKNPIFISNTILILTSVISVVNCEATNTPYLSGRTALLFYPLIAMIVCSFLAVLNKTHVILQLVMGYFVLSFAFTHYQLSYKSKSAREWWFDANTIDVMRVLKENSNCQQINLKTNWLFHPSFKFYVYTNKFTGLNLYDYDKEIDVNTTADFYYVLREDVGRLKPNFIEIASFDYERVLMKRVKQ